MAAYNRLHYEANKHLYKERARKRKAAVVRQRMRLLVEYWRENPCTDCGETDPLVLEFDHLADKAFDISRALPDRSWQSILAEIAKCQVVCANCHRRRTARRGGFARFIAVDEAE